MNFWHSFRRGKSDIEIPDGGSMPEELKIFYSNFANIFGWVSILLTFALGVFSILQSNIFGYLLLVISSVAFYFNYKNPKPKVPYIVLNTKGIKVLGKPFISWPKLIHSEIKLVGYGESARWHLNLELKNNNHQTIEISGLSESPQRIEKLIRMYKQSHKNDQ